MLSSDGSSPARNWRFAPENGPRSMRTVVAVTAEPMSSSSPVPCSSWPNSAFVYQSVCHGCAEPERTGSIALPGLSPSAVPSGPNASAAETVSGLTGAGRTAGFFAGGAGAALGAGADWTVGLPALLLVPLLAAALAPLAVVAPPAPPLPPD